MGLGRDRGADVVLTEISPEGKVAGRVFGVTLLVSAVALIGVSWDDIWRVCNAVSGPCVERSAGGMILTIGSIAAIGWGVGILLRIRRRPVDASGSSRYVWALGALFALGGIFIAARIPAFTCDRGHFDMRSRSACTHLRSRTPRAGCSSRRRSSSSASSEGWL